MRAAIPTVRAAHQKRSLKASQSANTTSPIISASLWAPPT